MYIEELKSGEVLEMMKKPERRDRSIAAAAAATALRPIFGYGD